MLCGSMKEFNGILQLSFIACSENIQVIKVESFFEQILIKVHRCLVGVMGLNILEKPNFNRNT